MTVLVLLALLALISGGTWWFARSSKVPVPVGPERDVPLAEPTASTEISSPLSASSREVLRRLNGPVEVRFYSVLGKAEGRPRAFARKLSRLLEEYERLGESNLVVKRFESQSGATPAQQDGLEPIRVNGGDINFLGLAVLGAGGQRAVIPRFAPEWEAAAEYDISRAIARVTGSPATSELVVNPPTSSPVSAAELTQALPELDSLSLEQGRQKLRELGLEEFKLAATDYQTQLRETQRRLAEAQGQNAEAEAAVRKELQVLQARQSERLREISQRMQARLAALEQLKQGSPLH